VEQRFTVQFVSQEWARTGELIDLSYRVLYRPFGLALPTGEAATNAEWMHPGPDTTIAVALAETGTLLGGARLLPAPGDPSRQVRQVAVVPDARGMGAGRALMLALEERALAEGAREVWLNARNSAYGFYGRLGYEVFGEEFISEVTGIPHTGMRKQLR